MAMPSQESLINQTVTKERNASAPPSARRRMLFGAIVVVCVIAVSFWPSNAAPDGKIAPKQAVGAKTTQRWAEFQKTVQPFFAKHCISCHSEKGVESDAPFDTFRDDASLDKGMPLLEKALDMLAAQKMPPRKKTQPTKDGSGWGVYAQQITPTGTPLGSEVQVNTYTQDNQFYSSVAGAANGDV